MLPELEVRNERTSVPPCSPWSILRRFAASHVHAFTLLFLLAMTGLAPAQDAVRYEQAAQKLDTDLRTALDELAAHRETVARERIPLATETTTLANDLRLARARTGLDRQNRDATQSDAVALASRVSALKNQLVGIDTLLGDFSSDLQVHMHPSENAAERQRFVAATNRASKLQLVDFALARLDELSGSRQFAGEALDLNGTMTPGTFIEVGPVQWFAGEGISGLVEENAELRSQLTSRPDGQINTLAAGDEASPAFDPSLGLASRLSPAGRGGFAGFLAHIRQGGVWILPILALGIIALLAAIAKWLDLLPMRRTKPTVLRYIAQHLKDGDRSAARKLVKREVPQPARAVLMGGLERLESPGATRDAVEEALVEGAMGLQPRLRRWLPFISIAAATAPLLGLLGTVTGMIRTFDLINVFGTGDAKTLAGGISEALVTTEFGLIVAIPALILHAWLSRRAKAIAAEVEMTSLAFLNGINTGTSVDASTEVNPDTQVVSGDDIQAEKESE